MNIISYMFRCLHPVAASFTPGRAVTRLACVTVIGLSSAAFAEPPTMPANFRHALYSSSAAEIFWQRSTDDTGVRAYELMRNGELVGIYDALSYFDDTLTPGVEYTYALRAIDYDGERSDATLTSLIAPSTTDEHIAALTREVDDLTGQLLSGVPAPLPATGQTTSYYDGDDGDWQAGISLTEPRFLINVNTANDLDTNGECNGDEVCNGTITDRMTGLVWLQNADCFGVSTLPEAIAQANELAGDASSVCGLADLSQSGDWRLPNILEAFSIVDYSDRIFSTNASTSTALLPTEHPFENVRFADTPSEPIYWTSTAAFSDGAHTISYASGEMTRWIADFGAYFWPVRDQVPLLDVAARGIEARAGRGDGYSGSRPLPRRPGE